MRILYELLRVPQWVKNLFVFAALIFSKKFLDLNSTLLCIIGFLTFSLLSSGVYILNDIFDREHDKQHLIKKNRPISSGKISIKNAFIISFLLIGISISTGFLLSLNFGFVLFLYFSLNIFYSSIAKKEVILDVILIAFFFVLRAVSGAFLIEVEPSPWLLICTFFLALFLAISKRRQELFIHKKKVSRDVLKEYSVEFLDRINILAAGTTIVVYTFYTFESGQNELFIITIPFVAYGILRYLFLVYEKNLGEDPTISILKDKKMMINLFIWGLISLFIVIL